MNVNLCSIDHLIGLLPSFTLPPMRTDSICNQIMVSLYQSETGRQVMESILTLMSGTLIDRDVLRTRNGRAHPWTSILSRIGSTFKTDVSDSL